MRIIGRKPVLELLESDRSVQRVMISTTAQGRIIGSIVNAAKKRGIRIDRITPDRVKREFGKGNHQGVAADTSPVELHSLQDLGGEKVPVRYELLLALDEVTDPHHLGAIARSALGAGTDALLMPSRRSAPLSDVAIKSSAGALLNIPLVQVPNLGNALQGLKREGWWVVGADAVPDATDVWSMDWSRPTVLVMGSEGRGIGKRIGDICDEYVRIPLEGGLESLSVSAAAAVLLYDVARKRMKEGDAGGD